MKKIFLFLGVFFTTTTVAFSYTQRRAADRILQEGILLYRLEKAAWYGTRFFLENLSHKKDFVGGFVSYVNDNDRVVNVFFERDNPSRIVVRFEFDKFPQRNPIRVDTLNQIATSQETNLIAMRQDAVQRVSENENGFFVFYENTSFNFIPLIQGRQRRVFILTAPTVSGVVLLGNDYLLTYNSRNRFRRKERLHNSLIQFPTEGTATFHSHVLSDLITSTDIGTLLLYRDFVEWRRHYVFSRRYVSIFELDTKGLTVITRRTWDIVNESQRDRQ